LQGHVRVLYISRYPTLVYGPGSLASSTNQNEVSQSVSRIAPSWRDLKAHLGLALRSSGIGTVIGALPGTGGDIAALLAYDHARRSTKSPGVPFGEGAKEGLVAPEAANNAAVGGAFIPMLTLGIPGDAVTAVIIGALFIHGLKPGPLLISDTPDLFWFLVGCLTLANAYLLIFGLTGIKVFVKLVECPKAVLIPIIIVLSVVGAFAIRNNPTDVIWVLLFGVIGTFMKLYDYPVGPVILGVILGPMMDQNYRRAMIGARGDPVDFVLGFLANPVSLALAIGLGLMLLSQTPLKSRLFNRNPAGRR